MHMDELIRDKTNFGFKKIIHTKISILKAIENLFGTPDWLNQLSV